MNHVCSVHRELSQIDENSIWPEDFGVEVHSSEFLRGGEKAYDFKPRRAVLVPYLKDDIAEKPYIFFSISMEIFKRIHVFWFDLKQGLV